METVGIYDSGANASLINSKLVKLRTEAKKDVKNTSLLTINGVKKTKGMINIKIKIFEIEENVDVYIVDDLEYEFLIGLNMIKQFKLIQNEDLRITQKTNKSVEEISAEEKKIENIPTNKKINAELTDTKNKEYTLEKYSINFNKHINKENFVIKVNHLNFQQKNEIDILIEKYKTVFAKDKYDIGTVKEYEARIDLMVDKYCSKRPYRCTIEDKKEIEEQISKLLQKNLIEESYSPFAAPVTLAFKKEENKKSRLCIDFRDLNKIVVPQAQPFPLIEELMIKTRNCKYFSTLDINSAFWSIPLRVEDRKKKQVS